MYENIAMVFSDKDDHFFTVRIFVLKSLVHHFTIQKLISNQKQWYLEREISIVPKDGLQKK